MSVQTLEQYLALLKDHQDLHLSWGEEAARLYAAVFGAGFLPVLADWIALQETSLQREEREDISSLSPSSRQLHSDAQRYAPAYGGAAAGLPGAARPPDETRLLSLGRSPILTIISAAPFLHTHGPHVPAQSSVRIFPFFDFVCSRTTRIKPNSQNAAGPPAAFLISTQRKTGQPMVDRFGGVSFQKRYFEKIVRLQRQRSGAAVMAAAAT